MARRYRKPLAIIVASRTRYARTYGNPYSVTNTTLIYRDGTTAESRTPRQYDQPNNCVSTAFNQLERDGLLEGRARCEVPSSWCRENGIILIHNAAEVSRERDL